MLTIIDVFEIICVDKCRTSFQLLASAAFLFTVGFFIKGGAIGVSPLQAGIYGLLASFLTMKIGHLIGQYFARLSNGSFGSKQRGSLSNQCNLLLDPSFASGSLLGILSLMSLQDVFSS
jgi:hypothetical protein